MKKLIIICIMITCIMGIYASASPAEIATDGLTSHSTYSAAITMPTSPTNYTVVNMRQDAGTWSDILGKVEMYNRISIFGEKGDFYAVVAKCTDGIERTGYISKLYVKPWSISGTAYTTVNSSFNYASVPCYRYPDSSSAVLTGIAPYTNINVIFNTGNWVYCMYNDVYGFVPASSIAYGWYTAAPLTQAQTQAAQHLLNNSIIFMPDNSTAVIKGVATDIQQPISVYSSRSMIPIRHLEQFVGATVMWNGEQQCATITAYGKTMVFYCDNNMYLSNGTAKYMDVKSLVINSRIHVPLRTVCDELGINIYYFGNSMPYIIYGGTVDYHTAHHVVTSQKHLFGGPVYFEWPVPASSGISSGWGDGRNHKGIDITAPAGTPVVACADGIVTELYTECTHDYPKYTSCCGGGYGNYIVIRHKYTHNGNSVSTRYSHLQTAGVRVGQQVSANEVIGTVGCTGRSTGNHLDFEITVNGAKTDPATYIKVPKSLHDSGNTGLYTQPYIDKLLSTQPTF